MLVSCLAALRPAPTSLHWAEQRHIQEETTFDDTTNAHVFIFRPCREVARAQSVEDTIIWARLDYIQSYSQVQ